MICNMDRILWIYYINIACGLYFFMVNQILTGTGTLNDRFQSGLTQGFSFYESYLADKENLHYYDRLKEVTKKSPKGQFH